MCIVCNVAEKDYVEVALAVQSTLSDQTMTIPLKIPLQSMHTIESIQSMLLNANLLAILF
jgi:hypothetical protein|tara:strand:- start:351 stop:530 length:180 start_codon:yes stop_codon:yes gene_type:complete